MIVGPSMPTPMTSRMPGTPAAPISWLTVTCSIGPAPWPPYSLGHVTPASPASASLPCQARRALMYSSSSPVAWRGGASDLCSSSHARTFFRNSACSGESLRSTLAPSWLNGQVLQVVGREGGGDLVAVQPGAQAGHQLDARGRGREGRRADRARGAQVALGALEAVGPVEDLAPARAHAGDDRHAPSGVAHRLQERRGRVAGPEGDGDEAVRAGAQQRLDGRAVAAQRGHGGLHARVERPDVERRAALGARVDAHGVLADPADRATV